MPRLRDVACVRAECSAFGVVGAGNVYRHGRTAAGERRFRCLTCGGTFTATTGSVTQRFRHDQALVTQGAGRVIFGGWSLREAADEVGVAPSTVARWVRAARNSTKFMADIKQARWDALPEEARALVRHGRELGFLTVPEAERIVNGDRAMYRQLFNRLREHYGGMAALLDALQE